MGFIASATTVYTTAYLTEKGREYLFNKGNIRFDANGNDLFQIVTFTLGDPDVNYQTTTLLETGEIPDVSGKNESCIKAATGYEQKILLILNRTVEGSNSPSSTDIEYFTDIQDDNNILTVGIADIPL